MSANKNELPEGYILAEQSTFQCEGVTDLRQENYTFCEFRFRGLKSEIEKLRKYIEENNVGYTPEVDIFGVSPYKHLDVSDTVGEIRIAVDGKTPELIEKFPALKVTGMVEDWSAHYAFPVLSESGYSVLTKKGYGGLFDGYAECGNGRWDWEYDLLESIKASYVDIKTGETVQVHYWYPFEKEWELDNYTIEMDGRIYIRNTPAFSDFEIEDGFLKGYYGPGGDVVIPSSVQDLRRYSFGNTCDAFVDNVSITTVYIPDSVKNIPSHTFLRCHNLKKVVLGDGIVQIADHAFCDCPALTEVVLPESITEIMPKAFIRCERLEVNKLKLSAGLQLAGQAFIECADIPEFIFNWDKTILLSANVSVGATELVLPDRITTIGDNALRDLPIRSVRLPLGLRHIGNHAFENCSELELIELPDTLESIGDYAFNKCRNITTIALPNSVRAIGNHAFSRSVKQLRFPETMTSIPSKCFRDLSGDYQDDPLETVTISNCAREVGDDAFYECINLTHVNIPETVKRIGERAFYNCKSLTELILPADLEQLDKAAVYGCKNLTSLRIPAGITALNDSVAEECAALTNVSLPNRLKFIKKGAFRGCKKLKQIAVPETVEEIGEGAFARCASLQEIALPFEIQIVGKEAFKACTSLTALRIPGTVKEIALGLAQGCNSLKTVCVEPGVQKIAGRAFKDCPQLEKVEIPASVTKIGAKVFECCPKAKIFCKKGSAADKYAQKNQLSVSYL